MKLSDIEVGGRAVIVKVAGHGGFRRRIVEMGFIKGQEDVMELEMNLMRHIVEHVKNKCSHELELLGAELPLIPEVIPSFRLSEAHEVLFNENLTQEDHRGEDDMAPEEERAICKYVREKYNSDFVFCFVGKG